MRFLGYELRPIPTADDQQRHLEDAARIIRLATGHVSHSNKVHIIDANLEEARELLLEFGRNTSDLELKERVRKWMEKTKH
jgi:hypothetical protein